MAAVRDGMPVDTTMGLTPAGGFMMGTRSGDLDPGIAIYLLGGKSYDADRLERLVKNESGLLGGLGASPGMKKLLGPPGRGAARARAALLICRPVPQKNWGLCAAA